MSSFFDDLPPEIIQMIFRYLSGSDLYLSFGDLNSRFVSLLSNYPYFSLDFRPVSKLIFDSVIRYIHPSNIYSLVLLNKQIELILSHWKLTDFVNLRTLRLYDINQSTLLLVASDIIKLSNLVTVYIEEEHLWDWIAIEEFSQLSSLNFLCYMRYCALQMCSPFPQLTYIAVRCVLEEISHILTVAPSLRSLNLEIVGGSPVPGIDAILPPIEVPYKDLTRLSLIWDDGYYLYKEFQWNEISMFLQGFSAHLKHLTLNLPTAADVLDGETWERFLMDFQHLKKFDVQFSCRDIDNWKEILDRFRTPFWCEDKKWYFAVSNCLYSTTCYMKIRDICCKDFSMPYHTAPNDNWFYSNSIIYITINRNTDISVNTFKSLSRFYNSEQINFKGNFDECDLPLLISSIETIVDLSQMRYVSIDADENNMKLLIRLSERMPHLSKLDISVLKFDESLEQVPLFDKIQSINYSSSLSIDVTDDFIQIFRNVNRLRIRVTSRRQMFRLINELIQLQSATVFHSDRIKIINRDDLIKRTRLRNHSFTIEHDVIQDEHDVHILMLWINHSTSSPLIKHSSTPSLTNQSSTNSNHLTRFFLFIAFLLFITAYLGDFITIHSEIPNTNAFCVI